MLVPWFLDAALLLGVVATIGSGTLLEWGSGSLTM